MSVPTPPPPWFASTLAALVERRDLDGVRMCELMHGLVGGACDEAATAALLVALAMKGETADELATAAAVLREYMIPLHTGRDDHLDTCGTGGDGAGTFNISTATAFVAAAAGVPVVKHGNRAASSRSGSSADVLAALGVAVEGERASRPGAAWSAWGWRSASPPASTRRCSGVAADASAAGRAHPVQLARAAGQPRPRPVPAARRGPARTAGPDGRRPGPAGHAARLRGLRPRRPGRGEPVRPDAGARGPRRTSDIATSGRREDFGLAPCRLEELRVRGPEESAAVIRGVLEGREGPALRIVLANAAAALLAAERVRTLAEGVERAADGRPGRPGGGGAGRVGSGKPSIVHCGRRAGSVLL